MNEMNVLTVNGASYALRDMLAQDMLADMCSGYNGVSYPDAGEAVRKQFLELEEKIRKIADLPGGAAQVNLFDKNSPNVIKNHFFGTNTPDMTTHALYEVSSYHISDYMPVKEGRYYTTNRDGTGFVITATSGPWTTSCWFYDENKTPISRPAGQWHTDTQNYTTQAPMGAKYARVDFFGAGDTIMFVEGQSFPDTYLEYDPKAQEPVLQVSIPDVIMKQVTNPLCGKTAIYAGCTATAGNNYSDTQSGFAGRIAGANGMTYHNFAVSGASITEKLSYLPAGTERVSVSAQLEDMVSQYPEADYIILEGGVEDANLMGSILAGEVARFGSFSQGDFSGNYDTETFCGALESVLCRALAYWRGKKIGFILPYKMVLSDAGYGADVHNCRAYLETAKAICKKWGVPVLDLWDGCHLNPSRSDQYIQGVSWQENMRQNSLYATAKSLLPAGYDYISGIIASWMKTL